MDLIQRPIQYTSFEEWQAAGIKIHETMKGFQWVAGDWLIAGEDQFTEKHSQSLEGWAATTLKRFAWVARNVRAEVRRPTLQFTLHQMVAKFDEPKQVELLDFAEANDCTVSEFDGELKRRGLVQERGKKKAIEEEESSASIIDHTMPSGDCQVGMTKRQIEDAMTCLDWCIGSAFDREKEFLERFWPEADELLSVHMSSENCSCTVLISPQTVVDLISTSEFISWVFREDEE